MTTGLTLTPVNTRDCCTAVTGHTVSAGDAQRLACAFKALGDPTRVRLLSLISTHPNGEACVCELTEPVGLSQPTVSHHMKQLVDARLVTREQRGRWAYYAVVPETLARLSTALDPDAGRTTLEREEP